MKGQRIISGRTRPDTLLYLHYQNALLQQQGAEMQQVLPTEFIFRPDDFKHIEVDQGAKCQRKLQRQPVPAGKVGPQPDVNAQYPGYPQNNRNHCQGQKPVCGPVYPFGEP